MCWLGQKINQYTIIERKGMSMNVYVGRDEVEKKEMIVKAFATNLNESDQKAMEAEMKVGMQLSHTCAFLVEYEEMIIKKENSFLIMEYCKGGDLSKMIAERIKINKPFTDEEVLRFFYQVGSGVRTLHKANIVHRDLKPDNIFLTENSIFKIGDFGIARTAGKPTVLMASIGYAPPEVFDGEDKPTKAMDIYSLGCIGLEMIDMHHPFANEKNVVQQRRVLSGAVNPLKPNLSPTAKMVRDFVLRMVSENPADRPRIEELLSLPVIIAHVATVYVNVERERDELRKEVVALREENALLRQTKIQTQTHAQAHAQAHATAHAQAHAQAQQTFLPVRLVDDTSNDKSAVTVTNNPVKCVWEEGKVFWGILDVEMSSGIYNIVIEASNQSMGHLEDFDFGLMHKSLIHNHADSYLWGKENAWCISYDGIYNNFEKRGCEPVLRSQFFKRSVERVKLGLELNADTHTLHFFVDGRQVAYCVADVPPSVHFVFSNSFKDIAVEVKSFQKYITPTIDRALKCSVCSWNTPILGVENDS